MNTCRTCDKPISGGQDYCSYTCEDIDKLPSPSDPQRMATPARIPGLDIVSFLCALEDGVLDDDEVIDGMQHLIDSGLAWQLQGSYGRLAQSLIDAGLCHA